MFHLRSSVAAAVQSHSNVVSVRWKRCVLSLQGYLTSTNYPKRELTLVHFQPYGTPHNGPSPLRNEKVPAVNIISTLGVQWPPPCRATVMSCQFGENLALKSFRGYLTSTNYPKRVSTLVYQDQLDISPPLCRREREDRALGWTRQGITKREDWDRRRLNGLLASFFLTRISMNGANNSLLGMTCLVGNNHQLAFEKLTMGSLS